MTIADDHLRRDAPPTGKIVLDLTTAGGLPPPLLRRLDDLARERRDAFNGLMAELSRGRERNIDWWVCRPATRNNHISALYKQCIQLALVRQLADGAQRVEVVVDSPEMARVLRRADIPKLDVVLSGRWRILFKRWSRALWDIASSLFHCLASATASCLTRRMARPLPSEPLTILDTFFMQDGVASGEFIDPDYPGLVDMLSDAERAACFYQPMFYRQRRYLSTFRTLRMCRANFILREDYLGPADYAFAFGHWLRVGRLAGARAQFAGFEVGALVDADLRAGRFASGVVMGLLAYRFLIAAPRHGIRIRRILDWYEGLDINHGIAAAVNWHRPEIDLIGFRSAGSFFYMSATPAPHEAAAGVVPRTLAMVGTRNAEDMRAMCPALHVVTGPGFRYRRITELRHQPTETEGVVLLALPMFAQLACHMVNAIAAARRSMTTGPGHWWVKCHPGLPPADVSAALGSDLPEGFTFVEGGFYDWLVRADIVISNASSTLIEAVALGVPSICLTSGNEPTEIPVPAWVDHRLSRVVYDAQEAAEAIAAFSGRKSVPVDCAALQAALLSPADRTSCRRLLGLDTGSMDETP